MPLGRTLKVISSLATVLGAAVLLSGCEEQGTRPSEYRAFAPLSPEALDLLRAKNTDQNAPMLIRAYKKEAELEVWKQKKDGKYVLFKTYPMCRWSGQLGPKVNEGDRQVPEGFYTVTPGQMNPNSHYYLSFNVGYPNAYDRANGHTGGSIMVHGICSSAGCFSMTDKQIEEIYANARESFAGGQRAIQMQSFPFRMTADNMAKLRLDPNMPFWRELKKGSDYFEVTKLETPVGVCGKKYIFGATPKSGRFDALSACPPVVEDPEIKSAVAGKAAADDREVAELVGKGVKPVKILYADGGQNETFKTQRVAEVSRPDALAAGPSEIALDDSPKAKPVAVQLAAIKANAKSQTAKLADPKAADPKAADKPADTRVAVATVAQDSVVPATFSAAPSAYAKADTKAEGGSFFKKWLPFGSAETAEAAPAVDQQAAPVAEVAPAKASPAPIAKPIAKKVAAKATPPAKASPANAPTAKPEQLSSALPSEITGQQAAKPTSWISSLMAFSPVD